jgi:hypothetical protein
MGRLGAVETGSVRFEMARKWLEKNRPVHVLNEMEGFQSFRGSIGAERFGQNRQKMQNRRWGVDGNRPQIHVAAADGAFEVPFKTPPEVWRIVRTALRRTWVSSSGGSVGERLFECTSHPHAERVEDAARAVDADVVVLVALVTGNLRLVHAEAVRQLALRETERDA